MQPSSLSANQRFALYVTKVTGTMPTAYFFCAISLISLPAAVASHDAFVIVSWISQSFLQLVLLPIIMVGQQVLGTNTTARTRCTSSTATSSTPSSRNSKAGADQRTAVELELPTFSDGLWRAREDSNPQPLDP